MMSKKLGKNEQKDPKLEDKTNNELYNDVFELNNL